jgi:hypothetical protein
VVQKALDELGEETAGILQRAHETADEISSRSRAQADTRLQRAEREAEILRRDADEYAEQVIVDTRLLWEERQRLIEDIRQLADEVLGTADDAMERLKLPEQLGSTSEPAAEGLGATAGSLAAADDLAPADDLAAADELPHDDELAPGEELPPSEGPTAVAPLPFEDRGGLDDAATLDDRVSLDENADAPLPFDDREDEAVEESGHTVELEALPGGSEEPPEHERR